MSKDKSTPEMPVETSAVNPEKLMYIGPTILKPVPLSHRSVFSGGRPAFLQKQPKEVQDMLNGCFVPLNQAAAALRELEGAKPAGQITEKYKKAQRLMRSVK